MYQYIWDDETGGILLTSVVSKFSKEPRPVYYKELDLLGFDKYWSYPKDDSAPIMWAETTNYIYKGVVIARIKGGAMYTPPELIVAEDAIPKGEKLQFVDVKRMVEKNALLLETLAQDTIQKIYNTYLSLQKKVDIFYVAFSGGKDSVVALDLVQRALPHNSFSVVFGNTDMEFPTTIELAKQVNEYCKNENIQFIEAKAGFPALESWKKFGPPARRVRWCCTVHKTAPVINELCKLYDFKRMRVVMITGVRGDESPARSDYDELSFGKKLVGQYSFHPILEWSSAEVFLYMFYRKLQFNQAYKYGFSRVGCIMCPNSSERHEYIKRAFFKDMVDQYNSIIIDTSKKDLSGENARKFLETGGWKTRLTGRELSFSENERFSFEEKKGFLVFTVNDLNQEWMEWYKTIGEMDNNNPNFLLEYEKVWRKCIVTTKGRVSTICIENHERTKNSIEFTTLFKAILAKSQYCIKCMTCVAECPFRNISMEGSRVHISDNCIHCHGCLKILSGCLYYNSIRGSKDMKNIKGISRYLSVGVDADWVRQYMEDQTFEPGNRKTDTLYYFLDDAGIVKKKKITDFGKKIRELSLDSDSIWAVLLCNLCYAPPFRWIVDTVPFNVFYDKDRLAIDMENTTDKAKNDFWNGMKIIFDSNEAFQRIGFLQPNVTSKMMKDGTEKRSMNFFQRVAWSEPDPKVILYSLYKYAEKCAEYQFTLTSLLDDSIERDGLSPTKIFGLDHETMIPLLNGLSANYNDFISANFALGLDTIMLRDDKTSIDVLSLF